MPQVQSGVQKTNGAIQESGLVIQQINIRPVARPEYADVQRWRTAHKTAESYQSYRVPLYDLYADALLDTFLNRAIQRRILNVTKNGLRYVIDDQDVEDATILINKQEFRKLRKAIQNAKAWGIAVIELMNENGALKIFDVPKKHIKPDVGIITYEQSGNEGIAYRDLPTVVEIGEYDDLGYILEAVPMAFIKRGDIGDWANYTQIFGQPLREAKYDGFNEQVRLQLEKAMERAAGAAYVIIPKDAEIIFHETQGTQGSNELYDRLRKAMNEEMNVHILGSTETVTSSTSSGYAQSETHQKTVDDIAGDDMKDELSVLNEKVQPVLVRLGLIPEGGIFIYDTAVDVEDADKRVDIVKKMRSAGVPVSDDYVYEITGVPKPDDYDAQKEAIAERQAMFAQQFGSSQLAASVNPDIESLIEQSLHHFFRDALKG